MIFMPAPNKVQLWLTV